MRRYDGDGGVNLLRDAVILWFACAVIGLFGGFLLGIIQ